MTKNGYSDYRVEWTIDDENLIRLRGTWAGSNFFWKDARWTHSHLVLESFNPLFKSVKTMYLVFNRLQMVLELGLHIR